MEQKTCPKCAGAGLIGSGENPAARVGRVVTCDECNGTGKVSEQVATEEIKPDAPVDNQPEAEKPRGGILGALGFK